VFQFKTFGYCHNGLVLQEYCCCKTLPGYKECGRRRSFVRSWRRANETQTFVDGIRVAQPYGATSNNLPTHGRFSPFCLVESLFYRRVIQLNMVKPYLVCYF
jgi:hypothetical protein